MYDTMAASPSPIVVSHTEELCNLLKNSNSSIDDLFDNILERRLDPAKCCPLSAYNYALLAQLSSKRGEIFNFSLNRAEKVGQTASKRTSRELFIKKFSCKSPVYHNCRIYASDGRLLCYCDRKKLEWLALSISFVSFHYLYLFIFTECLDLFLAVPMGIKL
jgi:cobalt/nickel-transporting P-type ATPase D